MKNAFFLILFFSAPLLATKLEKVEPLAIPQERVSLSKEEEAAVAAEAKRANLGDDVQAVFRCNLAADASSDKRVRVCSLLVIRPNPR